jgi:hypothetical protein
LLNDFQLRPRPTPTSNTFNMTSATPVTFTQASTIEMPLSDTEEAPLTLPKLIPAEDVLQEHVPTTDPAPLAVTKLMDVRADHLMDCRTVKLANGEYYIALADAVRKLTGQSKDSVRKQIKRLGVDTHM